MKVRESQIPEENGKPKKVIRKTDKADTEYFNDSFAEADEPFPVEDERKRLKKTVINFREEGIVISAYDLHTIEKDMRFVEHPKAHFEFGIIINKGLEPGQFVKKADIGLWYMTEEVRDEKYKRLLQLLESEGLSIIQV